MTVQHQDDAGMRAVARVRGVREQDSRLGLTRAAADEREAARRLTAAESTLTGAAAQVWVDLPGYLAARNAAAALATDASRARRDLDVAGTVSDAAREHWARDRTRLSAVELLLQRRAERRAAERDRRERAEADELATVRWLRSRRGGERA
jgi:flagellar FliJ protein